MLDERTLEISSRNPVVEFVLVILAGAAAALAGGWLNSWIAGNMGIYVPLIPGLVVGWTVGYVSKTGSVWGAVIAGVFGFAGMVFGDALTFDLRGRPGLWNYMTHFYEAATLMKVVFWALNFATAFWLAKGREALRLPAAAADRCPHCGGSNLRGSRFCAHCGQQISERDMR